MRDLLGWDPASCRAGPPARPGPSARPSTASTRSAQSFYREGTSPRRRHLHGAHRRRRLPRGDRAHPAPARRRRHVTGAVVTVTDTHDRDSALRALATLSQANRALVRATDEADLLAPDVPHPHRDRPVRPRLVRPAGRRRRPVRRAVVASAGEVGLPRPDHRLLGRQPARPGTHRSLPAHRRDPGAEPTSATTPSYQPWSDAATRHGFGCSISLPVRRRRRHRRRPDGLRRRARRLRRPRPGACSRTSRPTSATASSGCAASTTSSARPPCESQQRQRLQSTLDSMIDPFVLLEARARRRRRARRPALRRRPTPRPSRTTASRASS